jgi:hypothetical protein
MLLGKKEQTHPNPSQAIRLLQLQANIEGKFMIMHCSSQLIASAAEEDCAGFALNCL